MTTNYRGFIFFSLLAGFALVLSTIAAPSHGALINEIRIDQSGSDDDEYFELTGTASESLDGLTYLVIGDGSGGSGAIEAVVTLTGLSIPSDGFFLAAEASFSSGTPDLTATLDFENSDNVTHLLVEGFTGSNGDDLDTDDDGVLNSTPWTSIVDGVALIEEANPPSGTEYEYGTDLGLPVVGPDGSFVPGHVYRENDSSASDAWRIGGFDYVVGASGPRDTPGASNIPEPSAALLAMLAVCLSGLVGLRARWG